MKFSLSDHRFFFLITLVIVVVISTFCHSSSRIPATQKPYIINNIQYRPLPSSHGFIDTGIASWYGPDFHGLSTSNGERYNMYKETAAHKTLPMNTVLLVQNLENGRKSVVRINDRGPFVRGRIIDLSYATAKKLGILKNGTARVRITAMAPSNRIKPSRVQEYRLVANGEYYVQIGAFKQKNNALRLRQRFEEAGHTAVIRPQKNKKSTFYCVHVYAGTHQKHAQRAERALLEKGYKGAFIIAY